jgi:YD repeat-containing protein
MCSNGFHFCEKQQDVLGYYNYSKDFILLEVEALGNIKTDGNKTVTDCIKILRVVPREEWEFLEDNHIHYKDSNGDEWWAEYDSNGNTIHFKNSNGYEWWAEYDSNGNTIHFKNSNGDEWWREYDSNGNVIHYKNSTGYEAWREYDSNGNEIHYKNSDGYEWWGK